MQFQSVECESWNIQSPLISYQLPPFLGIIRVCFLLLTSRPPAGLLVWRGKAGRGDSTQHGCRHQTIHLSLFSSNKENRIYITIVVSYRSGFSQTFLSPRIVSNVPHDVLQVANTTLSPVVSGTAKEPLVRTEEIVIVGIVLAIWVWSCVLFYIRSD